MGGLAISDEAVATMLGRRPAPVNTARVGVLAGEIDERRDAIARRVAASTEAGVGLRLPRLADLFSLSPFERDVLVVCLAVEVDAKYERLYGYLHDDVTRRVPTVELILRLLCRDVSPRVVARRSFLASSPPPSLRAAGGRARRARPPVARPRREARRRDRAPPAGRRRRRPGHRVLRPALAAGAARRLPWKPASTRGWRPRSSATSAR